MKDEFLDPQTKEPLTVEAVLDTNCMMGIFSWSHLADALQHAAEGGNPSFQDPEVAFRCRQAEILFRLSLYFHEKKSVTYSVITEMTRVIQLDCPPDAKGEHHPKQVNTAFTQMFVHFVKDELFSAWNARGNEQAAAECKDDDEVDDYLIDFALRNGLPLITMEGWSRKGYNPNKPTQIPSKARAKNVQAVLPEDYYVGKLDEERAIKRFFARFRARTPTYLARHNHSDAAYNMVKLVGDYYGRLANRDWTS